MKMSEEFKQVIQAIHNLQQSVEVIKRGETADTGKYKYSYASLAKIWVEIKPILAKEGLTVMQPPTFDTADLLETWVFHKSGEWICTRSRLVINRDDPQGYGSAVSYARRYAELATLGLVTDDDNDATTQRLADGEMKKEWVRAFTVVSKKANPDAVVTTQQFISFMTDVYGKHPTKILAREHQSVLDTINAFSE